MLHNLPERQKEAEQVQPTEGVPPEHLALVARGVVLLGLMNHLLHKATPLRLGEVSPNT